MTNRTRRLFLRRLASGSLVASVRAIGFASTGQAQTLGPVVQVTGADPFTSCTKDNVGQQETEPNSGTRLLPWVFDGEPHAGPRMKDQWLREKLVHQFRHLRPL
jgi:hypothetical protein